MSSGICRALEAVASSAPQPTDDADFEDEVLALESIFDDALASVDPPSATKRSGLSVVTSLPVQNHLACAQSIAERTGKRAYCLSVAPIAEGVGCGDDDDDKSLVTFLAPPPIESGSAGVRAVFAPHATALAPFSLTFAPCAGYPSRAPPRLCVSAPWLPRGAAELLERELRDIWRDECAQSVCIFACADFLRTRALGLLLSAPGFSLVLPPNTPTRHVPVPERARFHRPPVESIVEREDELRCLLLEAQQARDSKADEWSPSRCCETTLTALSAIDASERQSRLLLAALVTADADAEERMWLGSRRTCDVCFDDVPGARCMRLLRCAHVFCRACVASHLDARISEGEVSLLSCPDRSCGAPISQQDVRAAWGVSLASAVQASPTHSLASRPSPSSSASATASEASRAASPSSTSSSALRLSEAEAKYQRYESLLLQRALDSLGNTAPCPRQGCGKPAMVTQDRGGVSPMIVGRRRQRSKPSQAPPAASAPPATSGASRRIGECAYCGFSFCADCNRATHGALPCADLFARYSAADEAGKVALRERYGDAVIADFQNLEYIREACKICPGCGMAVEKHRGCNHITCRNCLFEFCWLCSQPFRPGHFRPPNACKQFDADELASELGIRSDQARELITHAENGLRLHQ
jgi:E3 ubiquitin-protein ligase RNF14